MTYPQECSICKAPGAIDMPVRHVKQQLTVQELKQSILTLGALPRSQGRLDLSRKLDLLHRQDRTEFLNVIREGGLRRRTAFYLRKVGGLIRTAKLSTSQVERIGWTKLQIVSDKLNEKNAARLLKLADKSNAQELRGLVSKKHAKSKPNCVQLYLTHKQYEQFKKALIDQKAISRGRGIVGKEEALMRLIRLALR